MRYRICEESDLPLLAQLWNDCHPDHRFTPAQVVRASSKYQQPHKVVRWLAEDENGLAAALKYQHVSGADPASAEMSYSLRRDHPDSVLMPLLKLGMEEAEADRVQSLWVWELSGSNRDSLWLMNGFNHVHSHPFMKIRLDHVTHDFGGGFELGSEASGFRVTTIAEEEERQNSWIKETALLSADVERRYGALHVEPEEAADQYEKFLLQLTPEERRFSFLGYVGKSLEALALFRVDPLHPGRLLPNIVGSKATGASQSIGFAMLSKVFSAARKHGMEEIGIGGQFFPHEIEEWLNLGFQMASMWRRYHLERFPAEVALQSDPTSA